VRPDAGGPEPVSAPSDGGAPSAGTALPDAGTGGGSF